MVLIQVCKIVEGQRYSKRLNERQITALLKVTCQRPKDREEDIMQVGMALILEAYNLYNYNWIAIFTPAHRINFIVLVIWLSDRPLLNTLTFF